MTPHISPHISPCSSVVKASTWYAEGHGLDPRWKLVFRSLFHVLDKEFSQRNKVSEKSYCLQTLGVGIFTLNMETLVKSLDYSSLQSMSQHTQKGKRERKYIKSQSHGVREH